MYNVKGPSKIVAKTRRGITQNIDSLHIKNVKCTDMDDDIINGPKPVFQNVSKRVNHNNNYQEQQVVTPEQEEIIKYINESWDSICSEMDCIASDNSSNHDSSEHFNTSVIYYEDQPITCLENFKPFDLESWWGKRLFTYITSSVNSNNNRKS